MMFSVVLFSLTAAIAGNAVTGQVVDGEGRPIAQARVFLELGIDGALQETAADAAGNFAFENVPPGQVGVFAHAPGHAFGGAHRAVAIADAIPSFRIVLRPSGTLRGTISDARGKPIAAAVITRVGLEEDKVGIPLAKLTALGFAQAVSGTDGSFAITDLPDGGLVKIKVGHPLFAQKGVGGLRVGEGKHKVTMHAGVLVQGEVLTRGEREPVARAAVTISNAQPPMDSAVTATDSTGAFQLRLKPGVYLCQASGAGMRSSGWERLTLTGDSPQARLRLVVAPTGRIRGTVKDAKSGGPIPGARLALDINGNAAAVVRTGATGEFELEAAAGESVLRLELAPGYLPPAEGPLGIQVAEGQDVVLPDLWLVPIPAYSVQVLGADGTPVPGAVVSLLRPNQFGWHIAGPDGLVALNVGVVPADGKVLGLAEHPNLPQGALFSLTRDTAGSAQVQLLPLAQVRGRTVNDKGKALPGAVVGAVFPGEQADQELLLWRTVSGKDGAFHWRAMIPGVPQVCIGMTGATATGQSPALNAAPEQTLDTGNLTVADGAKGETMLGSEFAWYKLPQVCGPPVNAAAVRNGPALVVTCSLPEAEAVISGIERARPLLSQLRIANVAVVVQGKPTCASTTVPVFSGAAPGPAATYVMDSDGKVRLETFGLPPLVYLQAQSNP